MQDPELNWLIRAGLPKSEAEVFLRIRNAECPVNEKELLAASEHTKTRIQKAIRSLKKRGLLLEEPDSTGEAARFCVFPVLEKIQKAGRVTRRLWEDGGAFVKFQQDRFRLTRVGRAGKGLIVRVKCTFKSAKPSHAANVNQNWFFLYLPQPEDAPVFAASLVHLEREGPADVFPGAVGIIVSEPYREANVKYLRIVFIQGCFIQFKTPAIHPDLFRKYGGFRHRLFEHTFKLAKKRKYANVFLAKMEGLSRDDTWEKRTFIESAVRCGFTSAAYDGPLGAATVLVQRRSPDRPLNSTKGRK